MDLRSPVNIVARHEIYPDLIDDFWFTESALFSRLRENIAPFTGGTFTRSVFRFRPMTASWYKMGQTFNIQKVQTLGDSNFDMKQCQTSIPEFKEELMIYAKGEQAVFSLLDEDLENGLQTLTDLVSFQIWGQGQTDDSKMNGLSEFIGDGVLPQWDSTVATTYGGSTRNGTYGSVLNGNIFWAGTQTGATGPITWPLLEQAYRAACRGSKEPNLIVCNKAAFSYMLAKIEPQYQVENNVQDPYWGGSGLKFHNAYVMVDEHCPSLVYGLSDDDNFGLGNYLTGTINPNPVLTAKNNFPTFTNANTLAVGEVIFILNTDEMVMRITDEPEFAFGFSGFLGAQDSNKVVGRIQAALNFEGMGSRYQSTIFGIGS